MAYKRKTVYFNYELFVHDGTEKALKLSRDNDEENSFFLPKSQIEPQGKLFRNKSTKFKVPDWLAKRHRQLVGDKVFEEEQDRLEKREWEKHD